MHDGPTPFISIWQCRCCYCINGGGGGGGGGGAQPLTEFVKIMYVWQYNYAMQQKMILL